MMTMDDETLRAILAARTPGEWAPYCDEGPIRYRYLAPDGAGWTYSVCVGGYDSDHTCVLTATGPDEDTAHANAQLAASAPALAAEVLRLRERAERDEAERDEAEREVLHLRSERDEHAHKAGEWEESHGIELARAEMVEAAARAHLAADDALTLARRTDAADVPTAEARALAARECLAGLVGYVGEVGR